MKWNMILGSLVLGLGLCSQGFGFDLLDRMLGANGCGCQTSCCTSAAPSCAAPACAAPTCAAPAGPTCAAPMGPACGAEASCAAAPSCGGCCKKRCCGLHLNGLLGCHRCKSACNTGCAAPACSAPTCAAPTCAAAPACGAEPSCGCGNSHGCGGCHRPCLLDRLFSCHHRCCKPACNVGCGAPACAAPACGAEGGKAMPVPSVDSPPPPPAPVIDSSAYNNF